ARGHDERQRGARAEAQGQQHFHDDGGEDQRGAVVGEQGRDGGAQQHDAPARPVPAAAPPARHVQGGPFEEAGRVQDDAGDDDGNEGGRGVPDDVPDGDDVGRLHHARQQGKRGACRCAPAYPQPARLPDDQDQGGDENGGGQEHGGNQEGGWALIQATSSETVGTDSTVESRMARDAARASRPYNWASMNGPVPMGSALISTAHHAHMAGIGKTRKARMAVTAGCNSSLPATSRPTPPPAPPGWAWARNRPMVTSAQGLADAASNSR